MIIEVNKDIESYQESVVMGLSLRQFVYSIASVVTGGSLVVLLHSHIGLTMAVYVAIPVVAPIALGGFYTYNGMNFYEYMKRKFHFAFRNRAYTYVSTESEEEIHQHKKEVELKEKQKKGGRKGWGYLQTNSRN